MCDLIWDQVDLDRGLLVLAQHKTVRRTNKPRLIPLTPPLRKLLVWMRGNPRRYWHSQVMAYTPTADALRAALADGPLPVKEVVERMRAMGVDTNYRMLWCARRPPAW